MLTSFCSLDKKDGKTKQRVEGWNKGISTLTNDVKKGVDILDNLDNGEQTESGGGDIRKDYFGILVAKLNKDIEEQVRICQKVMILNLKKTMSQEDSD